MKYIFAMLLCVPLFAAISVESEISTPSVPLDGSFSVDIRVVYDRADADYLVGRLVNLNFTNDFNIVSSPQSVRTLISNNTTYTEKTFRFVLSPKRKGRILIDAIVVPYTIAGETNFGYLQTSEYSVIVTESISARRRMIITAVVIVLGVFILVAAIFLAIRFKKNATRKKEAAESTKKAKLKAYKTAFDEGKNYEMQGRYDKAFEVYSSIWEKILLDRQIDKLTDIDSIKKEGFIEDDEEELYTQFLNAYDNYRFGKIAPETETLNAFSALIKKQFTI